MVDSQSRGARTHPKMYAVYTRHDDVDVKTTRYILATDLEEAAWSAYNLANEYGEVLMDVVQTHEAFVDG